MRITLKEVFNLKQPVLDMAISKLESASGNQGIDTRLIGKIIELSVEVMAKLKLDIKDTTPNELFQSLMAAGVKPDFKKDFKKYRFAVVKIKSEIISLNAEDIAENIKHKNNLKSQSLEYAQREIAKELTRRYKANIQIDEKIVDGLMADFKTKKIN